jgi:hypothetical protein
MLYRLLHVCAFLPECQVLVPILVYCIQGCAVKPCKTWTEIMLPLLSKRTMVGLSLRPTQGVNKPVIAKLVTPYPLLPDVFTCVVSIWGFMCINCRFSNTAFMIC